MRGIILVGHGQFGSGLTSSLELITGKPENYYYHDFLQDMSQEDLTEKIQESIDFLHACDEILLLTDIVGGTPFKTSVMMSLENRKLNVVSGVNLPFLLSIHFALLDESKHLEDIINDTLNEAKEAMFLFDSSSFQ